MPSRIEKEFIGNTAYAAPVQSVEGGWKEYLSKHELNTLDHAERHLNRGIAISWAGVGLVWGSKLLLGATVATPFLGLVGSGLCAYALIKMGKNYFEKTMLRREAKRRQGEIEAMRKHGVAPNTPKP